MKIKKITLKGGGFKGAEVTYLREEEKNGHPFINEVIEKRKHPIHLGLETLFKDLRYNLLDITGFLRGSEEKQEKDYILMETDVVGVEFDNERFVISGERRVFVDKVVKIKTPKVDEGDQYEHYDTVMKIIELIVEETKEYMAGTKKVDDIEVAVRWVESGKSKDVTPEQLKGMSPEQLKEFATKLLENSFGAVVLSNDDYVPSQEELDEAIEEGIKDVQEEVLIEVPVKKIKMDAGTKEKIVLPENPAF